MSSQNSKVVRRSRRKRGIRKRVRGTGGQPRLTVFRSLKHVYAQIIDDDLGVTLCQASTRDKDLRDRIQAGGNVAAAKIVGAVLAERAKAKSIEEVRFDRNGYRFGGRIKGLADAAREAGLKF
ncbi:MAG: 50S ribosomal protein L18 [Phycisphaerales bacterium]|nr:MAG: 50S ribosomal protein L18 [Phycisphaerales bacterium]